MGQDSGVRGITNNRVKAREVSEKEIKAKIASAFHRQATLDSSTLKITVTGSTVTLEGSVRTWFEREEAERVAWASPGVFHVNNNIKIGSEVFV